MIMDGTFILEPADVPASFLAAYNAAEASTASAGSGNRQPARSWFKARAEGYTGLDKSIEVIRDYLAGNRIDVSAFFRIL